MRTTLFPFFLFLIVSFAGVICYQFLRLKKRKEYELLSLISKFTAVACYRKSLPRLQKEIARSRRLERPMSIIVVRPKRVHTRSDADGLNHIEFLLSGASFSNALRDMDLIAYDNARDQFVIALPESSKPQAMQTIERLANLVGETIADQLRFGTVGFPDDGLNIEDLMAKADSTVGDIAVSTTVDSVVKQARSCASS